MLAALLELAPSGVEQVDGDGVVELAVYGAPGELPELDEGAAEVGGVPVTVSATEVPDDWAERWRRFHVPVLIGERLYLRPPWEPRAPRSGVIDLTIDPGRAFGTGSHPTTRLALELLLELSGAGVGGALCDLGCGSGVLSIAAVRLGFGPVTALDSDPLALEATADNAAENGVTLAAIERFDLRTTPAPAADVVVANLTRPLLLHVAELMKERPRALIASGLLPGEVDEVVAAFAPLGERRRLSDGGWSALLLER
ncbi:MAG: 50S ribosomal protein L11 methyltransferase [Actinomycetota bacterium]|nr:50S ribosomal protein L11 methyltransferase [Actinomycetota bacterium]